MAKYDEKINELLECVDYLSSINYQFSEEDKICFLIELIQDKNSFNEFTKEIIQNQSVKDTYDKYKKIAKDFVSLNSRIG